MNIRHVALIVLLVLSSATVFAENKKKQVIDTLGDPVPLGTYSQGVCFRDLCFLAGQIPPLDKDGNPVGDDIKQQTDEVMLNIELVLEEAGLDFCDVVNSTVYLADLEDAADFDAQYATYFDGCILPARATVGAAIPRGALLEVAVIAAKQRGNRKGRK
jgi:2-iminobutanoate/2-iminopropanoate deaminase